VHKHRGTDLGGRRQRTSNECLKEGWQARPGGLFTTRTPRSAYKKHFEIFAAETIGLEASLEKAEASVDLKLASKERNIARNYAVGEHSFNFFGLQLQVQAEVNLL
jgi:hypothetical protein